MTNRIPSDTFAGLPATTRKADSGDQAGRADLINIISLHLADPDVQQEQFGMMVTPIRANNGRIKLIVWRLSEDGETLERLRDSGGGGEPVNGIAAARLSFQPDFSRYVEKVIFRVSESPDFPWFIFKLLIINLWKSQRIFVV